MEISTQTLAWIAVMVGVPASIASLFTKIMDSKGGYWLVTGILFLFFAFLLYSSGWYDSP